jgi:hypothetical protein
MVESETIAKSVVDDALRLRFGWHSDVRTLAVPLPGTFPAVIFSNPSAPESRMAHPTSSESERNHST